MKYHHLFQVKEGTCVEDATEELNPFLFDIYEMSDPETGVVQIGGYSEGDHAHPELLHSTLESSAPVDEIDWEKQWADFAPHFKDGLAHIDLEGKVLLLKPGAGFGDLSHPTTRLTLTLMAPLVKGKAVFDVGCGSGILSIAAALLGAKQVHGIDIDENAIKHSQENAKINPTEAKPHFSKEIEPAHIPNEPIVILMNMIESEQTQAWESLTLFHNIQATMILSGILSTQIAPYLQLAKTRKWSLVEQREEAGWVGFVFSTQESST